MVLNTLLIDEGILDGVLICDSNTQISNIFNNYTMLSGREWQDLCEGQSRDWFQALVLREYALMLVTLSIQYTHFDCYTTKTRLSIS